MDTNATVTRKINFSLAEEIMYHAMQGDNSEANLMLNNMKERFQ